MYGLIIECIIESIKNKYGCHVWEKVKKDAKIDRDFYDTHEHYNDAIIKIILSSLSNITGNLKDFSIMVLKLFLFLSEKNSEELMESFGTVFINFMSKFGYEKILRILGRSLKDFLNGIDNLHEYMRYSYPKIKPPSFNVESEMQNGLILRYKSKRRGLTHFVVGLIKEVNIVFLRKNMIQLWNDD